MVNHLKTHTGERGFSCPLLGCGKRFARVDALKAHHRIHENAVVMACPMDGCDKTYGYVKTLRKHLFVHHGIHVGPEGALTTQKAKPIVSAESLYPSPKISRRELDNDPFAGQSGMDGIPIDLMTNALKFYLTALQHDGFQAEDKVNGMLDSKRPAMHPPCSPVSSRFSDDSGDDKQPSSKRRCVRQFTGKSAGYHPYARS